MAKIKNKKNFKESNKTKGTVKKVNPFEVHINKQKFQVIGQKLKNDRGLPGISRAKAINKRKNTLLPEFNLQHKANQFLDRRIGEKNKNMTAEDKIIARFTAERIKVHKKKSIFNLGDDEILTHRGQTLTEIEKFDDPRSDDEMSDNEKSETGRLNADFVGDAHFGGGLLSNVSDGGAKSRKDLIDELIAESKKRKAEKQKMREETIQLTEKLDSEWRDLLPLVNISKRDKDDATETSTTKPSVDDYDKLMRELRFEARGQPTDRLKTDEEIAKEEKERLEKLEQDRLARMKGFVNDDEARPKHRSADDLDDDFVVDSDIDDTQNKDDVNDIEKDVAENDSESDESDDVETASEDDLSDLKADESSSDSDDEDNEQSSERNDSSTDNEDTDEDEDEDNEEEEIIEESKNISRIPQNSRKTTVDDSKTEKKNTKNSSKQILSKKMQNSESAENLKENKKRQKSEELEDTGQDVKKIKVDIEASSKEENQEMKNKDQILNDLLARKKIMEQARNELPYTFTIPDTYDDFKSLFETKSITHQTIIVERMIKCTHPSLAETNKTKLNELFNYILKYIDEISQNISQTNDILLIFQFFDHIMPFLYELAHLNTADAHKSILELLKEKQTNYRNKRKQYPKLNTIIYFKIISLLFPTSDFRHQIVTPAIVFMDQLLTRCKVKSKRDISTGLFLVTLVLEYVTLSKRFLPAAINFLRGIIHMAVPKHTVRAIRTIPPFKTFCSLLVLPEKYTKTFEEYKMAASDLFDSEIDDEYKIRVFYITIKLCLQFYTMFETLPSNIEIFQPIVDLLKQIPIDNYPKQVQKLYDNLVNQFENGKKNRKLEYLIIAAQRPKALRLYEPDIQQVFENRKHRNVPREKAERDKLIHKLKKEKKGALREIRRDNAFLTKLKIKEEMRSDMERKQKVKTIFSEAAVQQSELNSFDRKKKNK